MQTVLSVRDIRSGIGYTTIVVISDALRVDRATAAVHCDGLGAACVRHELYSEEGE
jgi:hypothetical protein